MGKKVKLSGVKVNPDACENELQFLANASLRINQLAFQPQPTMKHWRMPAIVNNLGKLLLNSRLFSKWFQLSKLSWMRHDHCFTKQHVL